MNALDTWKALAGLGLFLFGMHLLEEAVRNLAGRSFKKFILSFTRSPLRGVLSGVLSTAILQSSSLVTLLVMSFTGAGILGLSNGISIILGANLGTTVTGWIISLFGFKLNMGDYMFPLIALGGLGIVFLKKDLPQNICRFSMGFAMIFLGLNWIREGFDALTELMDLSVLQGAIWPVYVLFGFLLTAVIQSSSASVAIYLSALASGVIDLPQAALLVIGSDLGTTITALFGTIRANVIRKQTGYAQVLFNVIQGILALLTLPLYLGLIRTYWSNGDHLILLVALQSGFNLAGIILVIPFIDRFTQLLDHLVLEKDQRHARFLHLANPAESISAVEALKKEINRYAFKTIKTLRQLLESEDEESALLRYQQLKSYENEITAFYLEVQHHYLHPEEVQKLNVLVVGLRNLSLAAKDVKDIRHNLETLQNSVDENEFGFYQNIREQQHRFLDLIKEVFHELSESGGNSRLTELETAQKEIIHAYNGFVVMIQTAEHKDSLFDYSSLMNLIHELENSNDSMVSAYRQLRPVY